jgi:hypothetical protein
MSISNEGTACLTAIAAIVKYLRMERELKYIQTHRQAMTAIQIIIPQVYDQLSPDDVASAINEGINIAKENYDEYSSSSYFRGYLKLLEIWNIGGEAEGDLALGLLIYLRFCEEYEPTDITNKYSEDIESIIILQFNLPRSIFDQTELAADNIFHEIKDKVMNMHPIN